MNDLHPTSVSAAGTASALRHAPFADASPRPVCRGCGRPSTRCGCGAQSAARADQRISNNDPVTLRRNSMHDIDRVRLEGYLGPMCPE